jgi:hypothetical protein
MSETWPPKMSRLRRVERSIIFFLEKCGDWLECNVFRR